MRSDESRRPRARPRLQCPYRREERPVGRWKRDAATLVDERTIMLNLIQ